MTACGDTPAGEAAVGSGPASSAVPEEPAPEPEPAPAPEPEVPADAQGHGKLSSGQYWILDKDGVLTITGKGRLNPTNDPWIHYNVKAVVIGEGITSVAEGAFKRYNSDVNCVSLTLPSTVTKLEDYAFGDLTAMTELNLSEGLKTIGDFAFSGCTSLTPYPAQIALHTGA